MTDHNTDRRSFMKAAAGVAGAGIIPTASADGEGDDERRKHHQLVYWTPDSYTVPMAGFDVLQETIDRKLSGLDGCTGAKLCGAVDSDEETYAVWVHVPLSTSRERALELREATHRLFTHLENRYTIE